jgi:hypothetical protein
VVGQAAIGLSLIHFTTNSTHHFMVCQQEYRAVQAGLEAYMATYSLDTVAAASNTADMTTPVLLYNGTPSATRPTYVINSPTRWAYTWDTTGRITAIWPAGGGPAIPTGCVVSGG